MLLRTGLSCLGFALLGTAAGSLAPITGTVAAGAIGGVAGNIAGNFGTYFAQHLGRRAAQRYFARWPAIRENDVIIRELRRSQLSALRRVLQQWERACRTDPDPQRRIQAAVFSDLLGKFLDGEIGKIKTLTLAAFTGTTREEAALRGRILAQLPEAFDASLALRHQLSQLDQRPQAGSPVKKIAELVVLEELRTAVFEDIPALFLSAFYGGPEGSEGWFDLFVRDAAAKLKSGSEFERIWNAEQIALVRDIVEGAATQTEAMAAWLPEATKALGQYGMALDALAGHLDATRDYAKAVYERACGDKALPLDFEAVVSTSGVLRFSPRNPRVPFVGRVQEMAALHDFLAFERAGCPFAWWLITGGGGAGKTRLARQLCFAAHLSGGGLAPEAWGGVTRSCRRPFQSRRRAANPSRQKARGDR
jgi:hypothetical protein